MDEDTEVFIELAGDEHPDAETAAEDTARLLMEILEKRRAKDEPDGSKSSDVD
tara:strand:- start:1556 stop:1714 length:159 start_codon:yes stop_codon:yes gene_type:complete